MTSSLAFNLGALAALVPAAAVRLRRRDDRDAVFFAVLALGVLGPALWLAVQIDGAWRTGFAVSLWVTIVVAMVLFLALTLATRQAWRLTPLLVPYLLLLGIIATVWQHAPERPVPTAVPPGWLDVHIVFAVATYGLLTLAAVAGLAVFLQERALKAKRPTALTRLLPAMAESEGLEVRLLILSELVLALGLVSGMATAYFLGGKLLPFDHKTVFSLAAFAVIAGLLTARQVSGIRGRRAAHFALLAYLLLTLAYPGVKFVTDVLIG